MMLLLVTPALSQAVVAPAFPTHSVNGGVTLDVADITVNVPYGDPELKAAVSICISQEFKTASASLATDVESIFQTMTLKKTAAGYCATIVIPYPRTSIQTLEIATSNSVSFSPVAAPPKVNEQVIVRK